MGETEAERSDTVRVIQEAGWMEIDTTLLTLSIDAITSLQHNEVRWNFYKNFGIVFAFLADRPHGI